MSIVEIFNGVWVYFYAHTLVAVIASTLAFSPRDERKNRLKAEWLIALQSKRVAILYITSVPKMLEPFSTEPSYGFLFGLCFIGLM